MNQCRLILNCFCELRGMIVPIQTSNNYRRTYGSILLWKSEKRKVETGCGWWESEINDTEFVLSDLLFSENLTPSVQNSTSVDAQLRLAHPLVLILSVATTIPRLEIFSWVHRMRRTLKISRFPKWKCLMGWAFTKRFGRCYQDDTWSYDVGPFLKDNVCSDWLFRVPSENKILLLLNGN